MRGAIILLKANRRVRDTVLYGYRQAAVLVRWPVNLIATDVSSIPIPKPSIVLSLITIFSGVVRHNPDAENHERG
jgi:hypothetical protein